MTILVRVFTGGRREWRSHEATPDCAVCPTPVPLVAVIHIPPLASGAAHFLVPGICSPPPSRGRSAWLPGVSLLVLGKDAHRWFWPYVPDYLQNSEGSLRPAFSPLGILGSLLFSSDHLPTWPRFSSYSTHPSTSAALRESLESLSPPPTKEQPHLHPTCRPLWDNCPVGGRAVCPPHSALGDFKELTGGRCAEHCLVCAGT